ncbi:RNA polymerase sigma factor [Arthrobacter liuii]|uniref:RNA polymerase sigma factor n=1 Tax=Arthrobacter liuii TaxID=1476996 RepID=A0ABQ2AVR8_9MICC|nr:sigma-70 family RNA polymerase sigma factor [Arthrobacter liuii]GGH99274.1 RNA polymerase sigma factor [Arthrobacter liuii]
MTQLPPDSVLVAAASGEVGALEDIYRYFAPVLIQYFRGRGAGDPEGSCHDVLLTVFSRIPTVTGGMAGLRSFVFAVAHARIVDQYRWNGRQPPVGEFVAAADHRSVESAEETVITLAGAAEMDELLQRLGADQREALLLRIVADLSLAETARIMKRSTGAVKQLQRKGLIALRAILEDGE